MKKKMTPGTRTVWIIVVVAVVCLGVGFGASQLITSPQKAALEASAPPAGPITVPVESRTIENKVQIRGNVEYDDPVDVKLETGDLGGSAVVTGAVPEQGASIEAGQVVLQVSGRPVIALPGDLPAYRTLRSGQSGPDVLQLKQALAAIGIDAGDVKSDKYDTATANGVKALYSKVGYELPKSTAASDGEDGNTGTDETDNSAVDQAQAAVATAQAALTRAQNWPTAKDISDADAEIAKTKQEYENKQKFFADDKAACENAGAKQSATKQNGDGDGGVTDAPDDGTDGADGDDGVADGGSSTDPCMQMRDSATAANEAGYAYEQAKSARAALNDPRNNPNDVAEAQANLTLAQKQLNDAIAARDKTDETGLAFLPSSEVVYIPTLPRRVDFVNVVRGGSVNNPIMTVSGATLQINASASKNDAELLAEGMEGFITLPMSGDQVKATISKITAPGQEQPAADSGNDNGANDGTDGGGGGSEQTNSDRYTVTLTPGELSNDQLMEVQGQNVKVTLPVGSTDGEVMAVPLAAIDTGTGGEARVEKLTDKTTEETKLITVKTGLAANGYVEVTPATPDELKVGDLIVVGR